MESTQVTLTNLWSHHCQSLPLSKEEMEVLNVLFESGLGKLPSQDFNSGFWISESLSFTHSAHNRGIKVYVCFQLK